jgi:small subunit ribosomal protein S17
MPQPSTPPPDTTGDAAQDRAPRRTMVGTVISTKMEKTITIQVERMYKHPKYGKYIRERKRYHVHAPEGGALDGDVVEVMSTRPISKTKRWRLVRVVTRSVDRGAEVSDIGKVAAAEGAKPSAVEGLKPAAAETREGGAR